MVSGPFVVAIDMGPHLSRMKTPAEIETLWLDYVAELASEARADPARGPRTFRSAVVFGRDLSQVIDVNLSRVRWNRT